MARQSISLTEPNDEWLKAQVDSLEYSSKSELVNDLIRQARKQQSQIDWIRLKLEKAEAAGFIDDSMEDILERAKPLSESIKGLLDERLKEDEKEYVDAIAAFDSLKSKYGI